MQTTAARLLQLLSLLQTRQEWSGADLAAELGITPRTVRRDMNRLRDLGYPVTGRSGEHGGYRLGPGARMPPLLLDEEEAVAVAVALASAPGVAGSGDRDSSVRALGKLEQLLPGRLRSRVSAVATTTSAVTSHGATVDTATIALIAGACHRSEALRFHYRDGAGVDTSRHVEPYRLVLAGRRWYLLAWDVDRQDWRTFRVDRVAEPRATGRRFSAVEAPDAEAYVHESISIRPYRYRVRVRLYGPAPTLAEHVPAEAAVLTAIDTETCELVAGADSLDVAAMHIAVLGVDFDIHEPAELRARVSALAERLARAGAGARG
ncbi:Predicted DNA-binding transcriptional regulator YafY, contains an HTH and WYL domains [Haloechinothrix alba]|uniref:Predicted DNA-binding transcriptional regulator YafY, contains an HTH and WYL domains n=1 Tax=Haloechinothrix alba TaxID=664784 RepID=A0A238XRK9_9PSEU|nr:WYL domain-containing protein [Haloechinothrix alba]SNR61676.1 Predicted DNA-binding transcriptional regulator YafY, contains an HTH and WYL domains [Haloechinothrix alba]